jgi:hypothetical protein
MEEFINKMTQQVGIDKATAEKVIAFLKDNMDELPKLMNNEQVKGMMNNLPGGLGGMFGGGDKK